MMLLAVVALSFVSLSEGVGNLRVRDVNTAIEKREAAKAKFSDDLDKEIEASLASVSEKEKKVVKVWLLLLKLEQLICDMEADILHVSLYFEAYPHYLDKGTKILEKLWGYKSILLTTQITKLKELDAKFKAVIYTFKT